ncbi:response regulator transcription factor [Actinokineospora auranticolor]|uniref:DNA-binding NarL/FixJ family response regulator n=1 Tax=Actinokineospora auranticolor TaxID=155976 RepID=A0A2S6H0Z9_9PSEU|nr:response regulator transcription factor [Actinokineospora auranticolor]PPK71134.1 DNA-binding NarL/FixJ family response regulator [Actinokineospora auranticolor]
MIRLLLVDDEELVRAGLRMILTSADDITVVAEAADGRAALDAVAAHHPDVVLMDIRMPGVDGLTALTELRRAGNSVKVVVLTTFDLDDHVHHALCAGASGFLLKDVPPRDLITAVRTVAAGSAMLAPTVTKRLIAAFAERHPARAREARHRLAVLTDRERAVVRLVARGLPNAEIGRDLAMSEATVKAHVSRALAKLGMTNRVQAAILAHDAGLDA